MTRRQPSTVLGGSIFRAPNGYRAIPQYTPGFPDPQTVKQIYSNAKQRRYSPKWEGADVDARLVIYLTDGIRLTTGCCFRSLGSFVAYKAGDEFGLFRDEAKHRHPPGNFPSGHFADKPNDAFESANPTFWIEGHVAGRSGKAWARFRCPKCGRDFNPRNLRRLGKKLFDDRPSRYDLSVP